MGDRSPFQLPIFTQTGGGHMGSFLWDTSKTELWSLWNITEPETKKSYTPDPSLYSLETSVSF